MKDVILNSKEIKDYNSCIEPVIKNSPSGTRLFFPDDFFTNRSATPRLARYMFEQVDHGILKGVLRPLGTTSKEGYEKL